MMSGIDSVERVATLSPEAERRAHRHPGNAELREAFPALVAQWQANWRQRPWHRAAPGDGPDTVLEVLRAILDAAMDDQGGRQIHERLLRAALAHGEQRRQQGVSEDALLGEYHALRQALWYYLAHSARLPDSLTTIFRVDVVMSAASGLALRGFMRGRVPAGFPWERELARTMAEVSAGLARALG
jgi:hypothetical protein